MKARDDTGLPVRPALKESENLTIRLPSEGWAKMHDLRATLERKHKTTYTLTDVVCFALWHAHRALVKPDLPGIEPDPGDATAPPVEPPPDGKRPSRKR